MDCTFIVRSTNAESAHIGQKAFKIMRDLKEDKIPPSWQYARSVRMAFNAANMSLQILRKCVDATLIILLCSLIFLIMFQILGRYIFNYSISWSEEAATFVQVWLVMLGAGLAMRNRHHVGIDLLVVRFPTIIQQVAKSAAFLLGAWFLLVVATGSLSLIAIGMIVKSAALRLPMAVPYFALPIGMSYFLLEFALATLPDIYRPGKKSPQPAAGE